MKNKSTLLLIILSIFFFLIAFLVIGNYTTNFDSYIYELITKSMNDSLTRLWRIFTFLGSTKFIIIASITLVIILFVKNKKRNAITLGSTIIISTIINNVLKVIIRRERPSVLKLVEETTYSFPSGHTMASTTLYGLLIYYVIKSDLPKYLKVIITSILSMIIVGVGLSRVYLGAHFISDVLAGYIISSIIIIVVIRIDKKSYKL